MPESEAGLAWKTHGRISVRVSFFRFFFCAIHPTKKVERFLACMGIQDTDEPSSDRLIQEGRPHTRRPSFFFDSGISRGGLIGAPFLHEDPLPTGFVQKSRYWLRKHRIDMLVDSQRLIDYFGIEFGLENP